MSLIKTLATLTVVSGSAASEIISGSVYDRYGKFALYAPSTITGTLNLTFSPDLTSPSWAIAENTAGVDVTITADRANEYDRIAAGGLRISGSIQAAERTFTLVGIFEGTTRVLPDHTDGYYRI